MNGVGRRLDNGFERFDETVEVLGMENGNGEFVEEDEELEFELKRKVFTEKRG